MSPFLLVLHRWSCQQSLTFAVHSIDGALRSGPMDAAAAIESLREYAFSASGSISTLCMPATGVGDALACLRAPLAPLSLTAAAEVEVIASGGEIAELQPATTATITRRVAHPSRAAGARICLPVGLPAASAESLSPAGHGRARRQAAAASAHRRPGVNTEPRVNTSSTRTSRGAQLLTRHRNSRAKGCLNTDRPPRSVSK